MPPDLHACSMPLVLGLCKSLSGAPVLLKTIAIKASKCYFIIRMLKVSAHSVVQYFIKLLAAIFVVLLFNASFANAAITQEIDFQGKVVNSDGTNVADGFYDFVVKVYDGAGSAATAIHTENWTSANLLSTTMTTAPASGGESLVYSSDTNEDSLHVGQILWNSTKNESVIITSVDTSTNTLGISPTKQAWATSDTITNRIYVKDGIFTIPINTLQDVDSLSASDFNQRLYIGVNFNSDGEMKPRMELTAAPYAFNASVLDGVDSTSFLRSDTSDNYTSGTLAFNSGTTLDVNGDISIADTDITLDGASTNFTSTGDVSFNTSQLYIDQSTGSVGIGTTTPRTLLELSGDGAILATGTYGSGWTEPNLGAGTRLLWYPQKAAFRAGGVASTQWNDTSIGNYSVAFGQDTEASGYGAAAFGRGIVSSGNYAFAAGYYAEASAASTIAMGENATASGYGAVAIGRNGTASGQYSAALGNGDASGQWAIAIGGQASNLSAISIGGTASGSSSIALGYGTASGTYATSIGRGIEAAGDYSLAIALSDQTGTTVSQANTMSIMGGSVGIGTTAPSSLLHLDDPGAGNTPGIFIEDPTTTDTYGGFLYYDDSSSTLRLGTKSSGVEILALKIARDSGNISLLSGTDVNNIKTTVGSTGDDNSLVTEKAVRDAIAAGGGSVGGGWTDDGTVVRLNTSSDYVGIGETSPAGKLEIAQTDAANDEALLIDTEESTSTQDVFKIISDVGGDETTVFNIDADGTITVGGSSLVINGAAQKIGATVDPDLLTFTDSELQIAGNSDLSTGSAYQIGNENVLTASALGVGVTNSSLTSVGTITTGTWQGTAIADPYVANDLTISGGTIDNSVIGGTTAAAGTFTDLTATGTISFPNDSITDAMVSNTLTASYLVGSGSTSNAVDLATAEVSGTLADSHLESTIDRTIFNASDYITALGGIHVGGTTDPGTDNLVVDGTVTIAGHKLREENGASVTAGNWYRIAQNSGNRADAEFTLRDFISGGGHSTLRFIAGVNYNNRGTDGITVLSHTYYSTPTFTQVRIITNTTYDVQYLEVYANRSGSVEYTMWDNEQSSGWTAIDWTAGSIPSGYTAQTYDVAERFMVAQNGDSESFRMDFAGNVGIGVATPGAKLDVLGGSIRTNNQLISTIATGTAPLAVSSTTKVTNLNADLLDGNDSSYYLDNTDDQTLSEVLANGNSAGSYGIDMNNNLITNIGAAGTDFTSGGGLSIAGTLDPNGAITLPTTGISGAGSGSGLDADLLDGHDSSYFATNASLSNYLSNTYLNGRSIGDANSADGAGVTAYYLSSGASNAPSGTDHALFTLSYSSSWSTQLAADWRTNNWYVREQNNGTWGAWDTIWTSGNDGSGSGLDADLLDSLSSTDFARWYGRVVTDFNSYATSPSGFYGVSGTAANGPEGSYQAMINARNLDVGFQLVGGYNTDDLWYRGWASSGSTFYSWRRLLHSGNFNSYAPTLTGGGASGTWGISVTGSAGTLDGIDSSQFLRSDTDDSFSGTLTGNGGFYSATKDDITTRTDGGFWQTSTATTSEGWPQTTDSWYHLLSSTHSNQSNYYSMQFAGNFYNSNDIYYRSTAGSGTTAWNKLWHAGNDGSGSGLDADLLDGHDSSYFQVAGTYDNYSSWTLAGTSGTPQTISSGDTATIAAGTGITTTVGATDTVTIAATLGTAIEKDELVNSGTLSFDWTDAEITDDLTISSNGTVTLNTTSSTSEGAIRWDATNDRIIVGTGASTATFYSGVGSQDLASVLANGNSAGSYSINMNNQGVASVGVLSFNEGSNFKIDANASGLLFDGGDGTWDFLIYDDQIYSDQIRVGYNGNAIISTYDSGEDLQLTSNGGDVYVNDYLGIGNSAPSYALDVTGDQRVTGHLAIADVVDTNYVLKANGNSYLGNYVGIGTGNIGTEGYRLIAAGAAYFWTDLKINGNATLGDASTDTVAISGNTTLGSTTTTTTTVKGYMYRGLPIRFTRTTVAISSSNSTKDTTCTNEFGSAYQAATVTDLALNAGGGGSKSVYYFTTYGETSYKFAYTIKYGGSYNGEAILQAVYDTTSSLSVACIRKDANILVSRTTTAASNANSTKDTTCSTDYGSNYRAANIYEVFSYAASLGVSSRAKLFNVADSSSSWYPQWDNTNGTTNIQATTGGTYGVACIMKDPAGGADYAETILAGQKDIDAGDILVSDPSHDNSAVKSIKPYQGTILGVVPTQPGMLIGEDLEGDVTSIALAGRVPVKVTAKNGPINIGDPITSSDIAGVGMKATRSGYIVGTALSGFSSDNPDEIGTVTLFVNPGYYLVETQLAQTQLDDIVSTDETVTDSDVSQDLPMTGEMNELTVTDSLKSTGVTQLVDTEITGSLSINGDISSPLGNLTFQGEKIIMTKDGDLKLVNGVLSAKEVKTDRVIANEVESKSIKTSTVVGADESRGEVMADALEIRVAVDWDSAPAVVNLTPSYNTNVWVTDITKSGFTIHVEKVNVDQRVYWWAIW